MRDSTDRIDVPIAGPLVFFGIAGCAIPVLILSSGSLSRQNTTSASVSDAAARKVLSSTYCTTDSPHGVFAFLAEQYV
jgi:hypothetical protein